MQVAAHYFDGKTSRRHDVRLDVQGERARVTGESVEREAALAELTVSEAMGDAPRMVTFPDGAYCEVADHAALDAILASTGYEESPVVRWQRSAGWVALSLLLLIAAAWGAYRFAIPALAEAIAVQLPQDATAKIGIETWKALDSEVFAPSRLPAQKQSGLVKRFEAMPEAAGVPHQIVFRDGKKVGANAFALPSGIIVVTDQLVSIAHRDEEIMGVLAHELGHVARRHAIRLVLESTIVGLVVTWYVGDVSGLLASAPAALMQASYSRALEQEADDFAAALLKANGQSPSALADMLDTLEKQHAAKGGDSPVSGFLSSHPATEERKRRLRSAGN